MTAPTIRHTWRGIRGPFGRNVAWVCDDLGVRVDHCGHPTAIWPYYVAGQLHTLGTFRTLAAAQRAAIDQATGGAE